ncbi:MULTISPECIES: hypothetical protein [Shewanella]|uniref:hypothetical protein n=1 Tax=Shewanella TaxID=22 RepID=UPI000D118B4C|nr:hypothetical protein [Shewanella algae]EKT4488625.1 hypothetical protein [Shewanella algae]MBO2548357.1 hypothetical protein [Shewanella algae]PSS69793.1 hypothetical protein AYI85_09555 [Shewanella algae]HDS1209520.1 hypothetical protein [Shewanella algae]
MGITDWISIFMAVIATASAIITYAVFRSATDPEIIVYVDVDRKRPSFIILNIENIGKGPAKDIKFTASRELPSEAFGIEEPKEAAAPMRRGPIAQGVPYLAPGQRLVITWGQFGGLKKSIGISPISVSASYRRANDKVPFRKLKSTSVLYIEELATVDISDNNWDKKLYETLIKTNKQLDKISNAIQLSLRKPS